MKNPAASAAVESASAQDPDATAAADEPGNARDDADMADAVAEVSTIEFCRNSCWCCTGSTSTGLTRSE